MLDDDPTGGQTVADVPVVTAWESDDLEWLLTRDRIMGVVLTNSRALQAEQAAEVNRTIAERALAIGRRLGIEVSLISRSDSTLRGHVAAELRALVDGLRNAGQPADVVLLAPAFFEAGRVTHDDVHYWSPTAATFRWPTPRTQPIRRSGSPSRTSWTGCEPG